MLDIMFHGIWEEDERNISFLKHDTITKDTPYLKYQQIYDSLKLKPVSNSVPIIKPTPSNTNSITPSITPSNTPSNTQNTLSKIPSKIPSKTPSKIPNIIDEIDDYEVVTYDDYNDECEQIYQDELVEHEEYNAELLDKQIYNKFMYQ